MTEHRSIYRRTMGGSFRRDIGGRRIILHFRHVVMAPVKPARPASPKRK
jgi:hypothetical protein